MFSKDSGITESVHMSTFMQKSLHLKMQIDVSSYKALTVHIRYVIQPSTLSNSKERAFKHMFLSDIQEDAFTLKFLKQRSLKNS